MELSRSVQKVGDSINGNYVKGTEIITLDNQSNITTSSKTYKGTQGLWELIMLGKPTHYTDENFNEYENLVEDTQVIWNPLIWSAKDRPKTTTKYQEILKSLEAQYQLADEDGKEKANNDDNDKNSDDEEEEEENEEENKEVEENKGGKGMKFLPGDINGLLDPLKLLYGERRAGNIISTTNEIVAILDELLRKNKLLKNSTMLHVRNYHARY